MSEDNPATIEEDPAIIEEPQVAEISAAPTENGQESVTGEESGPTSVTENIPGVSVSNGGGDLASFNSRLERLERIAEANNKLLNTIVELLHSAGHNVATESGASKSPTSPKATTTTPKKNSGPTTKTTSSPSPVSPAPKAATPQQTATSKPAEKKTCNLCSSSKA